MLYLTQKQLRSYLLPFGLWRPMCVDMVWRVFKAVEDSKDRTKKIAFIFEHQESRYRGVK